MKRHVSGRSLCGLRSLGLQSLVLRSLVLRSLVLQSPVLQAVVLRSGRDAACRVSGSKLHVAAETGLGELIPRAVSEQFRAIATPVPRRAGRRPATRLPPPLA